MTTRLERKKTTAEIVSKSMEDIAVRLGRITIKPEVQIFGNNYRNFDSDGIDRINNIADSFDVIRESEHNVYVIYQDNRNFTENSKSAGAGLIKTLERNLDSNEYFKITLVTGNEYYTNNGNENCTTSETSI